jgi:hypothetical protein
LFAISLIVQVMPVTSAQADDVFPAIAKRVSCKYSARTNTLGRTPLRGTVYPAAIPGVQLKSEKMVYVVALRTAGGAVLSGIGNRAPDNFEAFKESFLTSFLQMKRFE